ncbi:MAG: hypothetical protein IPM98_18020, partial [Lewinellaceae bacterium]|nr:hypothetical protein [Lewinellaceae bacterium]
MCCWLLWQVRRTPYSFASGGPGSALQKLPTAAKPWRKITNGLPTGAFGRIALALAPSAPDNVFAIVRRKRQPAHFRRQRLKVGNAKRHLKVTARPFYFRHPTSLGHKDPKRVYRPAFSLSIQHRQRLCTFFRRRQQQRLGTRRPPCPRINPNSTNQLYLGTDGRVYMSPRLRRFLDAPEKTCPCRSFTEWLPTTGPYQVYGGLQDNGSGVAPPSKGGIKPRLGTAQRRRRLWVQPDTTNPDIVFA